MKRRLLYFMAGLGVILGLSSCGSHGVEGGASSAAPSPTKEGNTLTEAEREAGQFTPEILWKMGRIGGISLSPDRRMVLYSVSYYSVPENSSSTEIFLQGIDEAQPRSLGQGSAPRFVPGGNRVAYLRVVDGVVQLFEQDIDASDVTQMTYFDSSIENYWYSPDGKHLLYSQMVQVDPSVQDTYPNLTKANVRIIDDMNYRHWSYWVDGKYSHLFLADYNSGGVKAGKDLMAGQPYDSPLAPYFDAGDVAFSHDGSQVFYTCKQNTGAEYAVSTNSDILCYDIASSTVKNLTPDNPGYDVAPVPSPDGKYLLWRRMVTPGYESDKARLMCMDLASGVVKELTAETEQNADSYEWSSDAKYIYMLSDIQATKQVFQYDMQSGNLEQLTHGTFNINWASLNAN